MSLCRKSLMFLGVPAGVKIPFCWYIPDRKEHGKKKIWEKDELRVKPDSCSQQKNPQNHHPGWA